MKKEIKKPNKNKKIKFHPFLHGQGKKMKSVCGIICFPLIIHRDLVQQEQIDKGLRKKFSNKWVVSHLATGMLCGIMGSWDLCKKFVEELGDHPAFLMIDSDTLQNHPEYADLIEKYRDFKTKNNF